MCEFQWVGWIEGDGSECLSAWVDGQASGPVGVAWLDGWVGGLVGGRMRMGYTHCLLTGTLNENSSCTFGFRWSSTRVRRH